MAEAPAPPGNPPGDCSPRGYGLNPVLGPHPHRGWGNPEAQVMPHETCWTWPPSGECPLLGHTADGNAACPHCSSLSPRPCPKERTPDAVAEASPRGRCVFSIEGPSPLIPWDHEQICTTLTEFYSISLWPRDSIWPERSEKGAWIRGHVFPSPSAPVSPAPGPPSRPRMGADVRLAGGKDIRLAAC